uniref:Helicase ATP-binding domain-containing protein n=1 Tax=Bursaphelenchus xylophilus TaxID=6326 RepID=A0A1I7SW18_BURXY
METTINALKARQNACLESPTGTGKTLSLLVSTLSYIQSLKNNFKLDNGRMDELLQSGVQFDPRGGLMKTRLFPQVIYASRTHSQLKQVIKELNKTIYKATTSVAILAGRDQFCLNEKVKKQPNSNLKSQVCRQLIHSKKCHYHNQLQNKDPASIMNAYKTEGNGDVMDIEDLLKAGQKHQHCPFFLNRDLQQNADLILLPYNYVLDPKIREIYNINLTGNIIIFDEAHNLGKIAEESVSMTLTSKDVGLCIKETQECLEAVIQEEESTRDAFEKSDLMFHQMEQINRKDEKKEQKKAKKEDIAQFLEFLIQLEDNIDEFGSKEAGKGENVPDLPGKLFSGQEFVNLLYKSGFTPQNAQAIGVLIDRMGTFHIQQNSDSGIGSSEIVRKTDKLSDFSSFLSRVFSIGSESANDEIYDLFQLYFTEPEANCYRLDFWCFSPQIGMKYLQNKRPQSILLASGTLSPINNFIGSMGVSFPFVLENDHAAKSNQILVRSIQKTQKNVDLYGTFQNRGSDSYINGIGDIIVELVESVPQGMLVFFPSYSQMKTFLDKWKKPSNGLQALWERLESNKKLCVEPTNRNDVNLIFREFDLAVRTGNGAVMFAVCRGKMSEGIDFADCHCRAVAVVGIPFPPIRDPRVILKKRFLGLRLSKGKQEMSPEEWYRVEAIRAVNQALGRVIRHKDDFGVVILADARYGTMATNVYPAWIRPAFKAELNAHKMFAEVKRFFSERNLAVKKSMSNTLSGALKRPHLLIEDVSEKKKKNEESMKKIVDMYSSSQPPPTVGSQNEPSSAEPVIIRTDAATNSTFFSHLPGKTLSQNLPKRRIIKLSGSKSTFGSKPL